jgi:hypothetical protein
LPIVALDTRSTRDRRTLRPTDAAAPLSSARIAGDALSSGLQHLTMSAADPRLPKFIVSPVALLPLPRAAVFGQFAERIGLDDWSGFPRSQRELLSLVRDQAVHNVVLLSGDRHLSSVSSLWLQRADGSEIEIISIVSSGLYSPWPFANAWPDEYWLDGPFTTNDGAFKGRMDTPLVGAADSLAIVSVQLADDGVWTLEVTLDFAAGPRRARKRLDGDPAGRWEVWPKPPDR